MQVKVCVKLIGLPARRVRDRNRQRTGHVKL